MVSDVNDILKGNSGVQSLLGLNKAGDKYKVYPVVVPSSEVGPYIAVSLVSKSRLAKDCDFNYGYQVSSYAKSYDAVTALNDAVIVALEGGGYIFTNESDGYNNDHELYVKTSTFDL